MNRTPLNPRAYVAPLRRHWYTGRLLDRRDEAVEAAAERLPRPKLLSATGYYAGADRETHVTRMRFRLPVPARQLAPRVMGELLAHFLPDGNRCGCEHDCCGCPIYGTPYMVGRSGREVVVQWTATPNY